MRCNGFAWLNIYTDINTDTETDTQPDRPNEQQANEKTHFIRVSSAIATIMQTH